MGHVTVRVSLEENVDLLKEPARACLGFTSSGRPWIEPATLRYREERFLVGLERGATVPEEGSEVVLVVDEGRLFFELRAVYVRGHSTRLRDEGCEDGKTWIEVLPARITSWDYGRMRSQHG